MSYAVRPELAGAEKIATRQGFGEGVLLAARADENVVALCADLTESLFLTDFASEFPDRFVQVGVAEQNLVTVASGMAHLGKIPFAGSFAAFSPGRNWEQIRTTICLNNVPVKIIGSHAGLTVGPDGATHQMLEDIALMRVLPNMVVIAPGDANEARAAALAMARDPRPNYVRLSREKTAQIFAENVDFQIGAAHVLRAGSDVTLIGTGIMTAELLATAEILASENISAEIIHAPTIKPLDTETILVSAAKTGCVVTAEEAQIAGGLGGVVAELLAENLPTKMLRVGVRDRFGESGAARELMELHGLTAEQIASDAKNFLAKNPR